MKLDVVYKDELLTSVLSKGLTMQSLRHSIRDRLRAVECPSDNRSDRRLATEGAGQDYGERFELKVYMKWMNFILA
jgi:hypothetical protein